jgi:peptidoglycan/xylan/chitin deacetylase (PgdA/CDA1 family)
MASFLQTGPRLFEAGLADLPLGRKKALKMSALNASLLFSLGLLFAGATQAQDECKAKVYLTLDTGGMHQAETIAMILKRHQVKATFFLANEKTFRGDHALDLTWQDYWRARVSEGHQFGSHTFDHVYFKSDAGSTKLPAQSASGSSPTATHAVRPQFGQQAGRSLLWSDAQVCSELDRVQERFLRLTNKGLVALWRAPGGRAPEGVLRAAKACGYDHVYWAKAGFLGDELPSNKYPNQSLLSKALAEIRDGDILMAHLGIWSRKDPFAPMLDPLISGLKARGFCFATLVAAPLSR